MQDASYWHRLVARIALISPFKKVLLALAITATIVEIVLRYGFPRSRAYAAWTAGLEAVGGFWTAVLLSIVYFLTLSFVNMVFRLTGKDPLDRRLGGGVTSWHSHEPNPLGPESAARYQF